MIGIICNALDAGGGLEIVTLRLFEAFLNHNKEVKLYSCQRTTNRKALSFEIKDNKLTNSVSKKMVTQFLDDGINELIVQLSGPYDFLAKYIFYRMCKSNGISVYVVLHNSPKSYISRYRNIFDSSFVYFLKKMRTIFILQLKYRIIFKLISLNSHFVTISEGNKKELDFYYHIKSNVIPNYYEIRQVENRTLKKEKTLAYIGRIDFYQKNLKYLLDSWNNVKDKKDWVLNIIGSGNDKEVEYLKKYISNKKIDNIIFRGKMNQEQIQDFLAYNSILLLSSYFEGFPTVVIEAASYSNTLVVKKYDGFSDEILQNNENSFVIDGDEALFARKIQLLIDDDIIRTKYQNNIRERFLDYISSYDVVKKWISVFNTVENK